MDWGLVKRYVVDEVARLCSAGGTDGRADALEECLRLTKKFLPKGAELQRGWCLYR